MSTPNDGGPAFPHHEDGLSGTSPGMTLRDYFAAHAMRPQVMFPRSLWQAVRWALGLPYMPSCFSEASAAASAYQQADAMLAAREKGGAK